MWKMSFQQHYTRIQVYQMENGTKKRTRKISRLNNLFCIHTNGATVVILHFSLVLFGLHKFVNVSNVKKEANKINRKKKKYIKSANTPR